MFTSVGCIKHNGMDTRLNNDFLSMHDFLSTQQDFCLHNKKPTPHFPKLILITSVFLITTGIHLSELGSYSLISKVFTFLSMVDFLSTVRGDYDRVNRRNIFCLRKHKIPNHIFAKQKQLVKSISWLLRTSRSNTYTKYDFQILKV